MAVGEAFLQYVLEQLKRTGRITTRRMFGAVGIYGDGHFFALIDDDTLFFKVDDSTRPDYESRGMQPFRPDPEKPEVSITYYTVPVDVLDDAEELVAWARKSVAAAAAAKPKKPPKARTPKRKKTVSRARR